MTNSQPVPEQPLWKLETIHFVNFVELLKKTELLGKLRLTEERGIPVPQPTPAYELSMTSMV